MTYVFEAGNNVFTAQLIPESLKHVTNSVKASTNIKLQDAKANLGSSQNPSIV